MARLFQNMRDNDVLDSTNRFHIQIPSNLKQLTLYLDRIDQNVLLPQVNNLEYLKLTNFFVNADLMQKIVDSKLLKHVSVINCEFEKVDMALSLAFLQKRVRRFDPMKRQMRQIQSIS